jgi:hypothetical protein
MSRILPVSLTAVALLMACTSITIVRVSNGVPAGSPGSTLPVETIAPCRALKDDSRDVCVLTVEECKYGIGVVRSDRKGRNTEVVLQCFVPNANDNASGDDDSDGGL